MNRRRLGLTFAVVWLAAAPGAAAPAAPAQNPAPDAQTAPPAADPSATTPVSPPGVGMNPAPLASSDVDASTLPLQQYNDPSGRFGFVAPARWGRLPSSTPDTVVFESDTGDSISVSVQPLAVDPKAFSNAYVDTYLKVLAQNFEGVRYIGQRDVTLNFRKATDYVFSATLGEAPVILHQLVLLGGDKVLYLTFAGIGKLRAQSEALFENSLQSLWVSSAFGGAATASLADPDAPGYVLPIPDGWIDQGPGDGTSHMFRPPNSRPTAAFVSTRVSKLQPNDPLRTVDDGFVAGYAKNVRAQYDEGVFEMRGTNKIFLGGEPAVRYDFTYISNYGIRRAILVLCVRKGYLVGVSCDSAEQSYAMYDGAFESLINGFKFKS